MSRACALVLGLLVMSCSWTVAQTAAEEGPAQQAVPSSQLPDFSARNVPGEGVIELADFVSGYAAEVGGLPDFMQVRTADGLLRRISAAEAFALLARTAYLWDATGQLPETVPLAPDEVQPPVLEPEDVRSPVADLSAGRQIATDLFLSQCGATVSWVDTLHVIPTAVWVDGDRLSAAEYLVGLAICLQYAYWEGELSEYLFLPAYAPPDSWTWAVAQGPTEPAAAAGGEEEAEQALSFYESESEEGPQWQEPTPARRPLVAGGPELAPSGQAKVELFPAPGSRLSGVVDLVVSYSGPPAQFVTVAVDGVTRAILNVPPYGFRWDTSRIAPGPHMVRVQVLGEGQEVLADQISAFTIVPPQPQQPSQGPLPGAAQEPADEF